MTVTTRRYPTRQPEASLMTQGGLFRRMSSAVQRQVQATGVEATLFMQQVPASEERTSVRASLADIMCGTTVNAWLSGNSRIHSTQGVIGMGEKLRPFNVVGGDVTCSKPFYLSALHRLLGSRWPAPFGHLSFSGRVSNARGDGYLPRYHGSAVGGLGSARGYKYAAFGVKPTIASASFEATAGVRPAAMGVFADAAVAADSLSQVMKTRRVLPPEQAMASGDAICLSSVGVCFSLGPLRVDIGVPSIQNLQDREVAFRLAEPFAF